MGRHSSGGLYHVDGTSVRVSDGAGTGTNFTIGPGDNHCLYAVTKASGTVGVSFYKIPIATGVRTSFQHGSTSVNALSFSNGRIGIAGTDDPANIRVTAAAIIPGVVLTGEQLDGIVAAKTTESIIALTNEDSWVVDADDGLINNLVANNTNRSGGTNSGDDADAPAGWVLGVGGGGGDTAPANTVAPVVSGTTTEGQTLSCTTGTWTGSPGPSYSYQWQRDTGGGFSNIGSATSSTYLLDTPDVDADIRCAVTGTNSEGSSTANSNEVGPIAAEGGGTPQEEDTFVRVGGAWVAVDRKTRVAGAWV
jgi:hypothetical protein